MTSAFISYAVDDAAKFVDFLEELLDDWGVAVFRDRHSLGSGPYVRQFEREIPKREYFLNVVSKCAESSDWVDAEIQLAFRKGKKRKMVPLKLHSISLNDNLILGMLQYIDFTGWHNNYDVYDATFALARYMRIKLSYRECRATTDAALAKTVRRQGKSSRTRGGKFRRRRVVTIEKGDKLPPTQKPGRTWERIGPRQQTRGTMMAQYKTGQKAPRSGRYNWVRYTDGTRTPRPTTEEQQIRLTTGERFPPVASAGKAAWWRGPV
ncbi:MAG: YjzC family protein [Chloroflexi bacterium]|nr:YjzC family protein [Chloroflexota bacterium]